MIAMLLGGALMLGVCVFIHELGHYLLGKAVGVQAEIFSIGYGKGIWKKKIGVTTWQITAIPIGGYVKFYGDDILSQEKVPGGLLSVSPLKRIIPVLGGPIFNLILGFIIFILIHSLSGPVAPNVGFWEEQMQQSPAYKAGLRTGDKILAIADEPVHDFMDVQKIVALSGGAPLKVDYSRDGVNGSVVVRPEVDTAGRAAIGLRAPGTRSLEVNYPTSDVWSYRFQSLLGHAELPGSLRALPYLKDGDVILAVEGARVHSTLELQTRLGMKHGEPAKVDVKRQILPWLAPWFTENKTVEVPTQKEYRVELTGVTDLKYNSPVSDQMLLSSVAVHQRALGLMKFDGAAPGSFERLYDLLKDGRTVQFQIGDRLYSAQGKAVKIGLFGFRPDSRIQTEYLPDNGSIVDVFTRASLDTIKNVMIYPAFFGSLFSGRLSFIDNAMGPVGMFAAAGVVLKSSFHDYLSMFAAISIALFVMNLLPFPVVDGGHVVFFLYEAIFGKPVTPRVMESIYRGGLAVLIFLGLWIMYRDVLFVVGL